MKLDGVVMKEITGTRKVSAALMLEVSKLMSKSTSSSGYKIVSLLSLLSRWSNLHYGRIMLPNYSHRVLEVAYSYGLLEEQISSGKYTVPFDQGVTGFAWRTGQVILVTDVLDESIFIQRIAEPIEGSMSRIGFICVPILIDGRVIGVLSVQRRANPRRPYSEDVDLLRIISSMIGPVLLNMRQRAQPVSYLSAQLDHDGGRYIRMCESNNIVGSSHALLSAVKEIDQVKNSEAPIMLLGESGTGKEMFARMAHRESPRRDKPFICINCASIPEALLESELFGHEKGSFTGAYRRQKGKIEQAHEGTLFLDEIGDMPLDLQAKLLRVLQDKQIQSIGSDRAQHVNFRLITATHVNLAAALQEGRFRLDLYYRINVIPVYLPPLRKRQEDITRLAQHFLNHYAQLYDCSVSFTQGIHEELQSYSWPGNIRQLQNVIERAVLKATGQLITAEQINHILHTERSMYQTEPLERRLDGIEYPESGRAMNAGGEQSRFGDGMSSAQAIPRAEGGKRSYMRICDNDHENIRDAMAKSSGNQAQAARLLGMTARQFRYRLSKLGFESNLVSESNCL
jgi:Nif-specific regulatory protein